MTNGEKLRSRGELWGIIHGVPAVGLKVGVP
jgi:hypothetical protein